QVERLSCGKDNGTPAGRGNLRRHCLGDEAFERCAGLFDLRREFVLTVLEQIKVLLQMAHRLLAHQHIFLWGQHVEDLANLGNGHAQPTQGEDILSLGLLQ
ncbi:MAG: hypothetical protein NTZ54_18530, partial [Alphaproteobacteria bacterium]|nr:hypothetical protein [Alphaproteobacteria bacterium]